jgi:type IV pilus assembly protein PilC
LITVNHNLDFDLVFGSIPAVAQESFLFVVLCLVPSCLVVYLFYFCSTLPMRRNERARLFLDLLELGMKEGSTPEAAIMGAAASRDRSLGVRFHLLAAYLEQGLRLPKALEKTPRLLPPQILAMLKTGERLGDLSKVLPACRQQLRDGVSHVRGALNYLLLMAFVVSPCTVVIPVIIRVKVLPKFNEIFAAMLDGHPLPAFTRFVFDTSGYITALQVAMVLFIWLAALAYIGGPRLRGWLPFPGVVDWGCYRLPWRRKRLQRDFSAMLAVLLDGGVPEAEAVSLAAASTANAVLVGHAAKTCARLRSGVGLREAMRAMDDTGEFQWRLANALHRKGGFLRALTGWHEALDAKAFQLEQAAAQIITTALVLLNGVLVASIVIAVFLVLVNLINGATLW